MGILYLEKIPVSAADISAGRIVVHNSMRPSRRLGERGFRAWLAEPGQDKEPRAPEIGQHSRCRASTKVGHDPPFHHPRRLRRHRRDASARLRWL